MADLKAQLKTLLNAKEYRAAIVLLESSTLPDKEMFITRIKKRMAIETDGTPQPAPVLAKVKGQPVRKSRPHWLTCAYIVAIAIVLLGGAAVLFVIEANRAWDAAHGGLNVDQVIYASHLQNYCEHIEAPIECKSWSETVARDALAPVTVCEDDYDWIEDTSGYTLCLLTLGISMVPGDAIIRDVTIAEWTPADYDVVVMLVLYCDGKYNREYCKGWGTLIYRDHRNEIWTCHTQHNDQVGFTNCVIGLGVKV